MALIEKLNDARNEVRAVNLKLNKLENENYTELYNNGDLKYFEEIKRQLCMSAACIGTFVDHLEAAERFKPKFATLDVHTESASPNNLPPSDYETDN